MPLRAARTVGEWTVALVVQSFPKDVERGRSPTAAACR